ncbi:hypothetical protein V8E55_009791 [Tylopilus felleus]
MQWYLSTLWAEQKTADDYNSKQVVEPSCHKSVDETKLGLPAHAMEELMYAEMRDLTLVGLVALRDPPREDVQAAIMTIRRAGVRVFMVMGDFKLTAVAIAHQVGIVLQERIDTIEDVRAAVSEKTPPKSRYDVKPSEDDLIRSLVLTGKDVSTPTSIDWDVVVGTYIEVVFARDQKNEDCRGDQVLRGQHSCSHG